MFCENCGNRIEAGKKECPNCFEAIGKEKNANAHEDDYENENEYEEYDDDGDDAHQTLNGIKLSNEEFAVRTYRCSTMKFPSCTGYLSVTNRRVLYHGYGGDSRIVDEVPLDSVSGISTLYGGKLLAGRLIGGLLSIIGGIIAFANSTTTTSGWGGSTTTTSPMMIAFGIFGLIIGIALFATCYRKTFVLKVYSSKANNSPIDIGSGAGGAFGSAALFTVVAYPTDQTDKMMLELGAMIGDIQQMGNHGVERWKK